MRGFGFPTCGRGVMQPISRIDMAGEREKRGSMHSACLSRPAEMASGVFRWWPNNFFFLSVRQHDGCMHMLFVAVHTSTPIPRVPR